MPQICACGGGGVVQVASRCCAALGLEWNECVLRTRLDTVKRRELLLCVQTMGPGALPASWPLAAGKSKPKEWDCAFARSRAGAAVCNGKGLA